MKVKDLIAHLEKMPQNLQVYCCDSEWGYDKVVKPEIKENVIIREFFSDKPDRTIKKIVSL